MSEPRWVFRFIHRNRLVEFGPHEDERAARESFQARYGYWPKPAIESWEWDQ